MNWATIAPETRLYKGKNLFRWEDSPGLEHHCGICATPLHNGRAKTTCIGKHVEPCYRFHQQLHFVGKSHECFGCNSSDEMHHNRHKDILRIIRQLEALDIGPPGSTLTPGNLAGDSKGRRESLNTISTGTITDTASETASMEESRKTRRERKKSRKSGNSFKQRLNFESFPKEELDFISRALHRNVHESKGAWQGTYVYGNEEPVETQTAFEGEDGDMSAYEVMTAKDDLAVKSPAEMTPRQRKTLKKFSTPIDHSSFRGGSKKFFLHAIDANNPYGGIDPAIFKRLGVKIADQRKISRARKDLIIKLVTSIKDDLEIIGRENVETDMRKEGFLRWAGKTTWQVMQETRRTLDWATGQKITHQPEEFVQDGVDMEIPRAGDEDSDVAYESSPPRSITPMPETDPPDPQESKRHIVTEIPPSPTWNVVGAKKARASKKQSASVGKLSFVSFRGPSTNDDEEADAKIDEMVARYGQSRYGEKSNSGDMRKGGQKLTPKKV